MEVVCTSETSFNFNVTTRGYIPEDSKLQLLNLLVDFHEIQYEQHAIKCGIEVVIFNPVASDTE
jgi:hypothetical protein